MKIARQNTLLNIDLPNESLDNVLEKIIIFLDKPHGFFHIASLNPEIFLLMQRDKVFEKIVREAQVRIIDGTYVYVMAKLLGIPVKSRIQGVELMEKVIQLAARERLRVVLIGAGPKIAERVAVCQRRVYPRLEIVGIQGIKNIHNPTQAEEERIFSIVADTKPHFVFVAFGSPMQEKWIFAHKKEFEGKIVAGVGGAFDFLSGVVPRAPRFIRAIGGEWLFRLVIQPWRWRRQIRIIKFFALVVKERLKKT